MENTGTTAEKCGQEDNRPEDLNPGLIQAAMDLGLSTWVIIKLHFTGQSIDPIGSYFLI